MLSPNYTGLSPSTNRTPIQCVWGLFSPDKWLCDEADQSSPYSTHIEATTARRCIPLPRTPTLLGAKCRNNCGFANRGFKLAYLVEKATTDGQAQPDALIQRKVDCKAGTEHHIGVGDGWVGKQCYTFIISAQDTSHPVTKDY
jgi:hypothetical protein